VMRKNKNGGSGGLKNIKKVKAKPPLYDYISDGFEDSFVGGCYFSGENCTCLPSRIMFVVLTAHILPHIEQECLSAGGMLSK